MGRKRTLTSLLACAGVVGCLVWISPLVAFAGPSPDQSGARYDEVVSDIQHQIRDHGIHGYTGASIDRNSGTVDVYWAMASTRDFSKVQDTKARSLGIGVRVHQVPYSREQIWDKAKSLIAAAKAAGIPVSGAGSSSDFTGMKVNIDEVITPAVSTKLHAMGATEVGQAGRSVPLARNADIAPFWAGAQIEATTECSLGFMAQMATGWTVGLSARHCGINTTVTTPAGSTVGTSSYNELTTDTMAIFPQNLTDFEPAAYVGPFNSYLGESVRDKADPALGSSTCTDGGFTGLQCDAKVTDVNYWDSRYVGPGYMVQSTNSYALVTPGDSGSPGLLFNGGGKGVIAQGMLSSGDANSTNMCPPGSDPSINGTALCYARAFYVYQSAIENKLGVTILTM
jgi:hypothetical protein